MSLSASVGGHLQLKKIALTPLPLSGRPSDYQRLASSEPPQELPKSAFASCAGFQKLEFQTLVNRPQIRTTTNLPGSATDHQSAAGGTTMSPPPRQHQEVASPGAAQAAMLSSSPIMQAAAASTTPAKPNLQMLRLLRTSFSVPRLRPAPGAAATSTIPAPSQHPQQLPVRAHLAFSRPTISEIRRVVATTNANGGAAAAGTVVGMKSRSHAQHNDDEDIVLQEPRSSTPVPHKLLCTAEHDHEDCCSPSRSISPSNESRSRGGAGRWAQLRGQHLHRPRTTHTSSRRTFNPRGRAAPSSPASSASWSPTNGRKKQTAIAVRNARKALPLHSQSGVNRATSPGAPGAVLQPRQPPHPHTGGGSPSARIVHEIFFKKCEHIPGVVAAVAAGAAKNGVPPGFLPARRSGTNRGSHSEHAISATSMNMKMSTKPAEKSGAGHDVVADEDDHVEQVQEAFPFAAQGHEEQFELLEPERELQEGDDGNKKKPAFRLNLRVARDGKSAWDEMDRFAGLKLKSKAKPHCPRRRGAAAATSQHLAQRYNAACVQLKKTQEKAVAKAENFSASSQVGDADGVARRERAQREIQRLWNATVDRNAALQGSKNMNSDNTVVRISDEDAAIKGEKSSLAAIANGEQLVELEKLGDIFQHDRGTSSLGPAQRRAHERDHPESVAEEEGAGDGDEEVVDVQPDDLLSKVVPGGRPSSPPEAPAPAPSNPPAHQWLLDEVESLNREVVQEGGRGQLPAQRNIKKRNNNYEHSSTGSTVQTEVERTTLSPKVDSHTWSPDLEAVLRAEEEDVALLEQVPPATRAGQKFLLKDIARDLEIDFDPGFYSGSGESSRKDDHQLTPRSPPMHHFPVHEQKLRLQYHCLRKSARVACTKLAQLHAKMLDMGVFPPRFELELENQILVGAVDDRGTAVVDVQEQATQTPVVGRREVGVDAPVVGNAASRDNASGGGGAPERINGDEAPGFVDDEDEDEVLLEGDSGFGALQHGDVVHGLDGLGDTVFDVENEAEASGSASIEEVITFVSERLGGGEHSPLRYPPPATHSSNYPDAVVQVDGAVNVVNDDGRMGDDEEVDVIPTIPGGAELDNSGGCGESSSAGVPDEEEPFAGPGALPVPVAMKTKSTGQPRVGHVQLVPRAPSASGAATGVAGLHEQRADLLSRTLLTCCYTETPTSSTKIQPLRLDFLTRSTTDLTAELKVPFLGSSTTTTTGPVVLGNSCPGRSSLGGPGGEGGVLVTKSYTTTSAGRGGRAATGTTGVTTSASRQQHQVEKEEFSTDDRTPKRLKNRASRVSITADAAPVGGLKPF